LAKNLEWMDRLNELRRVPAHGFQRNYHVEDFEFLDWIYDEFKKRVEESRRKEEPVKVY